MNSCVLDYIWNEVKYKKGFKKYDYDKLKNELYKYVENPPMINTEEILNWVKSEEHNNISIHAYDSRFKKFITHTRHQSNIILVYIVKDNHLFPILNQQLKIIASKANSRWSKKFIITYDRIKVE